MRVVVLLQALQERVASVGVDVALADDALLCRHFDVARQVDLDIADVVPSVSPTISISRENSIDPFVKESF